MQLNMNSKRVGLRGLAALIGASLMGGGEQLVTFDRIPNITATPYPKQPYRDVAFYGRRTASGHTRTRSKNRLHVSKAARRKHRKAV